MTNFFSTNPLATPVGQLIERASDATNTDDNVQLIYEICDLINSKEEHAKDALKAIRKKLTVYAGRNWSVVLKLLNLLELCASNCSKKFQLQLANKDFLNELKNMIGPKLQPPINVQEKVLHLIQNWANTFRNDPDFKTIDNFYNELRCKGIDFPVAVDDNNKNILSQFEHPNQTTTTTTTTEQSQQQPVMRQSTLPQSNNAATNQRNPLAMQRPVSISNPQHHQAQQQQQQYHHTATTHHHQLQQHLQLPGDDIDGATAGAPLTLSAEQTAKLNSELDVVESNVQVFNEVLNELQSQNVQVLLSKHQTDIELLRELNRTCKEMQNRITHLIGSITNENIIGELLRINDDLNNVFLRYDRFERNLQPINPNSVASNRPTTTTTTTTTTGGASVAAASASVFTSPNRSTVAAVNQSPVKVKQEEKPLIDFNEDIDIRLTTNTMNKMTLNPPTGGLNSTSNDPNAFLHDENEIKEMENWLKNQGEDFNIGAHDTSAATAAAATPLLTTNTNSASQQQQQQSTNTSTRQVKTDTKSMFAL